MGSCLDRRLCSVAGLARRLGVAVVLAAGLSACAVGHLSSMGSSRSADVHQGLKERGAALKRTAWDRVVRSPGALSAWATILMEGSDNQQEEGLAASAASAPKAYLALKAKSFKTDAERLRAVVSDVEAKTIEADSFIAFARNITTVADDRTVLEQAVADLRDQKSIFAEVEREMRDASPPLDTTALKRALIELDERITTLAALSARG